MKRDAFKTVPGCVLGFFVFDFKELQVLGTGTKNIAVVEKMFISRYITGIIRKIVTAFLKLGDVEIRWMRN